jgi:murein DD-endopeptidase MepM/ murein hydrolase activator NlpD
MITYSKYFKTTIFNFAFYIILLTFFSSCSQKPAIVINRNKNSYHKDSEINLKKYQKSTKINNNVKQKEYNLNNQPQSANNQSQSINNTIIIQEGDTLYSLSKKHSVILRDLINQNNLTPPYSLKAGSTLILPKPFYHEVKAGETLYSISRDYQTNINQIYEMNDFGPETGIKIGQKIRIAKFNDKFIENITKSNNNIKNKELQISETRKNSDDTKIIQSNIDETENNKSNYQSNNKINKPILANNKNQELLEKSLDKVNKFIWPVDGKIISKFGPKDNGLYNDGINIMANIGDQVKSSEDGIVAYVGNELKGYGNLIIIKHNNGWITAYAHLGKTMVKIGDKISKSTIIAEIGNSGNVKIPQLYFSIRKGRDAVNPENYLIN